MVAHENPFYTLTEISNILCGTAGFSDEMLAVISMVYPDRKDISGKSILEAGCGSGKIGMFFGLLGMGYTGMDIDGDQLKYADKLKAITELLLDKEIDARFINGTVHKIDFQDNYFNFVFSEGVIEHWIGNERQNVVNEMARVAKDAVMIFVPNAEHPESQKIAKECVHTYKGMGKKEHPLSVKDLRKNLFEAGLKDVEVHPCNPGIQICRRMIFGVGYKK